MRYNELLTTLQNLTNIEISQNELSKSLDMAVSSINYRKVKNANFTNDEVKRATEYFCNKYGKIANCETEFVQIPVYGEVNASCGYGAIIDRETQTNVYPIPKAIINGVGANEKTCDIVFASGNSMEPSILQGDALMVDRSKKEIIDGQIYVIRYDNELMCKRLQKLPPKRIKVVSDNEKYSSYEIDISEPIIDFEVIGRVMWYSRIAR